MIVLAAFVATPAVAASKKKMVDKNPRHMTQEEAMEYNKRNLSLFVKGLPLILPSWATPIYFGMIHEDEDKGGKKK